MPTAVSASLRLIIISFPLANHHQMQLNGKASGLKVAAGWPKTSCTFPSLTTSRLRVSCSAAKPETVEKVCSIVRKQLALSHDIPLTPDSKFSDLGADSLDTVEIVMGLEEEFGITVEEEGNQNISTVQEAADLIEKLIQIKA